jgi:hypothetical protein
VQPAWRIPEGLPAGKLDGATDKVQNTAVEGVRLGCDYNLRARTWLEKEILKVKNEKKLLQRNENENEKFKISGYRSFNV